MLYKQVTASSLMMMRSRPCEKESERNLCFHSSGGLDLIVVPGLAFTAQSGHRLGSGRGYYDRYFEKLFSSSDSRPFLMGLAFHQQILPDVPIGHLDVAMDQVITCTE